MCYDLFVPYDAIETAERISRAMADAYFFCHPQYSINLGHQAVRILHLIENEEAPVTIGAAAKHLGCAQNTASEAVHRLVDHGMVKLRRSSSDARVVGVFMTRAGERALAENVGYDRDALAAALAELKASERQVIVDGYEMLARHLRERERR